ncbi:helix-turn-helix domain-containing protein [Paraburkholderia strydomiana]|uniref:helix-turn-helix domain-containing protein n=1 Tax=Paraburkholderia strydomiana TaxID=1245417 RepID=UPI002863D82A|nr:XRE family transcriptional regulator [Paraburkholderia strydomiana]MDR7006651.1 Zn-dependent peptidase ImmA (M78 family)/DNA-binding XRE family transcriptional regulator [Paraburkholderia strydomiana]
MRFIGSNLRTARLFHGMSLQELGEQIGRSKQFLSRIESGVDIPTSALVTSLCDKLAVLPDFFTEPDPMPIADEQCHFRKQLTTKVALHQIARARGELLKRMVNVMDEHLALPKYDFDEGDASSAEAIEQAAERAREHWDLGLGPIQNMTRIAENAGAVVMPVNGLAAEIDAISFATRRPVIAINPDGRSACRTRFGIAHEMGHFCLHIGVQTGDKLTESQANRFASAFLMPRRYFAAECRSALRGSRLNWTALSDIKLRWGVSKAATLYRGRQLGVFSEEQYRTGVISLNRRGEARGEDEDGQIPLEVPELIADSMQVLREAFGISRAVLAHEMKVQVELLDELLSARFAAGSLPILPDNVVTLGRASGVRSRLRST